MAEEKQFLDRSAKKMRDLHAVTTWLVKHWHELPDDLYQLKDDEFVPYDIKEFLFGLALSDLANLTTTALGWRWLEEPEPDK